MYLFKKVTFVIRKLQITIVPLLRKRRIDQRGENMVECRVRNIGTEYCAYFSNVGSGTCWKKSGRALCAIHLRLNIRENDVQTVTL